MTEPHATLTPPTRSNPMLGIGLKVCSVLVFLVTAALVKATAEVPIGQMVFFRSFFAVLPIILFLAYRGELVAGIRTKRPVAHFWRGIIGVTGMCFGLFGLATLPLPEAVAISYAMPLIIVIFGAVFLKEEVRFFRWSAVVIGFVGVTIILSPRLTVFSNPSAEANLLALGAGAALVACFFGAFGTMHSRFLLRTERSATIVLYFSLTCSVAALLMVPLGWISLTPQQLLMLIALGVAGGIGQILLTESFRHADVSVVAPFEYTSLVFSMVVGYFVFSEVPGWATVFGGVIVVAAGLFIIWRERALGIERRKAQEVTPPQ